MSEQKKKSELLKVWVQIAGFLGLPISTYLPFLDKELSIRSIALSENRSREARTATAGNHGRIEVHD
jgi:hypothetical protein